MTIHRFFVGPKSIREGTVSFDDRQSHQIANVLRLRAGTTVQVFDNSGWEYEAKIVVLGTPNVQAEVVGRALSDSEPRMRITLYQGLLRASKFETVLQKCTELGVSSFVPTITERTIIGNVSEVGEARLERWRRIVMEAAEQSGRGKVPALRPAVMFDQSLEDATGLSLIAWEHESTLTVKTALSSVAQNRAATSSRPFSVNLFVGPEGGFSQREVDMALFRGAKPITLGKRILRAETAAVTACTLVLYEAGDMGA